MTQRSTIGLWAGSGAIATAVHLVLVQQGLAAYGARNQVAPPPVMPQVEILAVASSVAGEQRPVETVAAVQSARLQPKTSTEQRAETATAARVAAKTAEAARLGAVAKAATVAPAPRQTTAPSPAAQAVAVAPARAATEASSVTPTRPSAPSVTSVKSTAQVVTAVPKQAPGLSPPALAPVAVAPVSVATAPAPATATVAPVSPISAPDRAAVQPVAAVSAAAPETVAAVAEPVPSLPPRADTPARDGIAAPEPDQTPQENVQTYQSVLDVLAEMPKAPCFAALPTLSDESAFQLEVFAQTTQELSAFASALAAKIGQPPNTTMKPISAAQCAAAAYVIDGPAYPRFDLFFDIPQREIKSGEALEGRIGNTSGGFISFLVIDDEGTVQDLAGYLQFVPGGAKFRIPLSLTGSPVVTQQLLMAISTPALLQTVIDMNGTKADDFFPALAAELRSKGQSEDVALVAFSVE